MPTRQEPKTPSTHYLANEMALSLAQAEKALLELTRDQVEAIVDPEGNTYLLRPAQEDLLENKRWLDTVIESSPDVITVVNRQGEILLQNRRVNRILGYQQENLIGTSLFKLVRDEDLAKVYTAFFNVIEGFKEHATAQFNHLAPDGTYRMVEATMGRLQSDESQGVVVSVRPLEQPARERIEFQQHDADSTRAALAKDRFLAMLAHELRTPLMPVLLGIGELQADERHAGAWPILAMMQRNIEMQARLIEELSDFTSVGQHKVRLRPEPVDVHEALSFVLEICDAEIAKAHLTMVLNLDAKQTTVLADPVRLQQVMWNILRNAIKFSPAGGTISITSANDTEGKISLSLTDHGLGIAEEFLSRIFDPFEQGDSTIQKRYGGLGLGMFIAKGLAEAQGGTLSVSSEGLGHGSTFRLTLDMAPQIEIPRMIDLLAAAGAHGKPDAGVSESRES